MRRYLALLLLVPAVALAGPGSSLSRHKSGMVTKHISERLVVVETNIYTSDFSAGADGWLNGVGGGGDGAVAGNIDSIGGLNNNLRYTIGIGNAVHKAFKGSSFTVGKTYRIRYDYYIPAGQSHIDGARASDEVAWFHDIETTTDAWTSVDVSIIAQSAGFAINAYDGESYTFQDIGADDVFYVRNVIIDVVTSVSIRPVN